MADIQPVQAPQQIAPIQAPEVAQVRAYQSPIVANTAAPRVVDTAAPQLSGPMDFQAPTGTLAGPRQVVTGGNTVGIADPHRARHRLLGARGHRLGPRRARRARPATARR